MTLTLFLRIHISTGCFQFCFQMYPVENFSPHYPPPPHHRMPPPGPMQHPRGSMGDYPTPLMQPSRSARGGRERDRDREREQMRQRMREREREKERMRERERERDRVRDRDRDRERDRDRAKMRDRRMVRKPCIPTGFLFVINQKLKCLVLLGFQRRDFCTRSFNKVLRLTRYHLKFHGLIFTERIN